MKYVVERVIRVLVAAVPLWCGACAAGENGETGEVTPGIGNAAGFGAAGTFGSPGAAGTMAPRGGAPAIPGGTAGVAGPSGASGMIGGPPIGAAGMMAPAGMAGTSAMAGSSGMMPGAGAGALAGTGGTGGATGGAGTTGGGTGECCADGNCLCHGPDPSGITTGNGPYDTDSFRISTGTVYYPTDAEPPLAGVALCGGFLNTGPEMAGWGPFYASHGIVTVITTTTGADLPDLRATKLLRSIEELKAENSKSGSPLMGKLSDRFGTSGYSMGGGGTTIATTTDKTLKTSVGLAPWAPVGAGISTPTLLLCGSSDGTAPCSMAQSSYRGIPEATPKMMITFSGATHFSWFGPGDAGRGESGAFALAFQKVYLEGDERWKPILLQRPSGGTVTTNIQ
jgi:hypothetical protein